MRTARKFSKPRGRLTVTARQTKVWSAVLVAVLTISCVRHITPTYVLKQSTYRPGLHELRQLAPGFATSRYTLLVMFDLQIAYCALGMEMDYWPIWKDHMEAQGFGFAFITSRSDSMDVAVAMQLEENNAPVYTLPGCEDSLSNLWAPGSSQPLKLLIDSTGTTQLVWLLVKDSVENERFLTRIDSVIASDSL